MLKAAEIIEQFNQEIQILHKLWQLEQEKRSAIMGARGGELQALSQAQEKELKVLSDSSSRRESMLARALPEGPINLSAVQKYFDENCPTDAAAIRKSIQDFREKATTLQAASASNQELLEETNASVRRLLDGLKENIQPDDKLTYQPAQRQRQKDSASLILNANA